MENDIEKKTIDGRRERIKRCGWHAGSPWRRRVLPSLWRAQYCKMGVPKAYEYCGAPIEGK